MEGEKGEAQQQRTQAVMIAQSMDEDEISLFDLLRVLARRKYMVWGITFSFLIIAVGYAVLATPVYKSTAYLLPPTLMQTDDLRVNGHPLLLPIRQGATKSGSLPKDVFNAFVQNLHSRALQTKVVRAHQAASNSNGNIIGAFHISQDKNTVEVSLEGPNADLLPKLVNDFVGMVNRETVHMLVQEATIILNRKEQSLLDSIAAQETLYSVARQKKISRLEEALHIAERLGVKDRADGIRLTNNNGQSMTLVVNGSMTVDQLYRRGSKVLSVEIAALRQRKNGDLYSSTTRDLKRKLLTLKSVRFDESHLSAMRIDMPAMVSHHSIKPKRGLIIVSGFVSGIIVGVFAAFFAEFLANARKKAVI